MSISQTLSLVVSFVIKNRGGFVWGGSEHRPMETIKLLDGGREKVGGSGKLEGEIVFNESNVSGDCAVARYADSKQRSV
jgi:hypothetical protein